ncbi:DNA polymerase delta subunit 4 [Podarcis lilfordi]|uniref:DNA polymerase delta subunit 4 n=1 Tax=Podarcis lilfordi TaxID=74358 RepID=A0AA35JPU6_9SAUR|nr:DNA polymerase delta subunit 4 [Podarcis lilfordi]
MLYKPRAQWDVIRMIQSNRPILRMKESVLARACPASPAAAALNAKRKQRCHWSIRAKTTGAAGRPRAAPRERGNRERLVPAALTPQSWHRPQETLWGSTDSPRRSSCSLFRATYSFQVVKKRKRDSKETKKAQSPLHDAVTVQAVQDAAHPDQLETLKQFDLSWQYGPCAGITRLQRWERAELLGLNPPAMVRELLEKHNKDPLVTYSLWHGYCL